MARRVDNEGESERVNVDMPTEALNSTVRICSLRDGIINIQGKGTGNWYKFPASGIPVDVDSLDAAEILGRRSPKSCCGPGNQPLFGLVD